MRAENRSASFLPLLMLTMRSGAVAGSTRHDCLMLKNDVGFDLAGRIYQMPRVTPFQSQVQIGG